MQLDVLTIEVEKFTDKTKHQPSPHSMITPKFNHWVVISASLVRSREVNEHHHHNNKMDAARGSTTSPIFYQFNIMFVTTMILRCSLWRVCWMSILIQQLRESDTGCSIPCTCESPEYSVSNQAQLLLRFCCLMTMILVFMTWEQHCCSLKCKVYNNDSNYECAWNST